MGSGQGPIESVDQLCERIHRAGELGFTDVVIPWPRPAAPFAGSETALDRLPERLTDGALKAPRRPDLPWSETG